MRKGVLVVLAMVLSASLLLAGCATQREATPKTVTFATTPMPGGKYLVAAAMAKVLSDRTLPTSVVGVGGGFAQVMTLAKGTAQLATPMTPEAYWAYIGYEKYKEFKDMGKQKYLRKVMTIFTGAHHIMVMKDSPVKTLADLPKMLYNQAGTYSEMSLLQAVLEAYGIPESSVTFKPMAAEEKYTAFADRRIDTLTNIGTIPSPGYMDMANRFEVRFLSWDEAKADAMVKKYAIFEKVVIPAGTYKQPERIIALGQANDVLTYESLSEDLVYRQVKALLENQKELAGLNRMLTPLNAKYAIRSHAVPYHNGAVKYYKEVGVWTAEHEKTQQELLSSG